MLITRCLHHPQGQSRIDEAELVDGLLNEFIPVRQDQGPPAAALHQESKHNRFAGPGGQDEQRALHAPRRGREQGRDGFVLVGPWGQTECGWWRRHSLHHTRSERRNHSASAYPAQGSTVSVCKCA
jgi:hypothetical protein